MNIYQQKLSSDSDIHNNIPLTVLEFYSPNLLPEELGMIYYETVPLFKIWFSKKLKFILILFLS